MFTIGNWRWIFFGNSFVGCVNLLVGWCPVLFVASKCSSARYEAIKKQSRPGKHALRPAIFSFVNFFLPRYPITFFHSAPKLEQATQITTATHPSLFWIFILILNWNSLPVKYILSVPDKKRENSTLECYEIQPTRYGKCQPSQIFVLLYECLRGERHINNSIWSASCQWGIIILIIIIITSPSLSSS